jgi:SAM-dependent methyltransferase
MARPVKRRPFQGVWTIIRFNWHLHAAALAAIAVLLAGAFFLTGIAALLCALSAVAAAFSVLLSLLATWHAYDASGLYQVSWLAPEMKSTLQAANVHAGFDETSVLLKSAFPRINWHVFDFHDPAKHTEISIRRARRAQPPSSETMAIRTDQIPLADSSLDRVLLILAAHEIRDHQERVEFFRELKRVLAPCGRVIVTEHLRDLANIAAYSIGAWHFHSRDAWLATFHQAGFRVAGEFRNNLLITTFVLEPDENTA